MYRIRTTDIADLLIQIIQIYVLIFISRILYDFLRVVDFLLQLHQLITDTFQVF